MKKVWIVNHYASTPQTGIGGRTHYMARELVRLGYDVTVICARYHHLLRNDVDVRGLASEETVAGYRLIRLAVPKYSNAHDKRRVIAWFVFAAQMMGLSRGVYGRPDILVYSSPQLIGWLSAKRLARSWRIPIVFDVRDIWPLTLVEIGGYSVWNPFILFLQWIEDRAYSLADRVVCNLEDAEKHMVARGMDRDKFVWISNGVDTQELTSPESLNPEVDNQLPRDSFRIVYMGTLGVANALDTLVESAALVRDLSDVAIILVGNGLERGRLEDKCNSMGLNSVKFIDPVPKSQVQSVLSACDICYIGLSSRQLFRFGVSPNKLFDYFLAGKPILSAIDAGETDLVERYNAGITVPAENPHALADAIRRFYAMGAAQRKKMGENGRGAVLNNHDYAKLTKQLERVLLQAIRLKTD